MKIRGMNYRVIDDYFPEWIVKSMSAYFEIFPVTWSNSSRDTYAEGGRFFGNMMIQHEEWVIPEDLRIWFIQYLNGCVINDILKGEVTNVERVLVNGQVKGQDGVNHTDHDDKNDIVKSVIYHAHGHDGDTVIGVDRIPFKEGRLIVFDSYEVHRGEAPKDNSYRVSLGCIYTYIKQNDMTLDEASQMLDKNK